MVEMVNAEVESSIRISIRVVCKEEKTEQEKQEDLTEQNQGKASLSKGVDSLRKSPGGGGGGGRKKKKPDTGIF